jgi:hypothetical protein
MRPPRRAAWVLVASALFVARSAAVTSHIAAPSALRADHALGFLGGGGGKRVPTPVPRRGGRSGPGSEVPAGGAGINLLPVLAFLAKRTLGVAIAVALLDVHQRWLPTTTSPPGAEPWAQREPRRSQRARQASRPDACGGE